MVALRLTFCLALLHVAYGQGIPPPMTGKGLDKSVTHTVSAKATANAARAAGEAAASAAEDAGKSPDEVGKAVAVAVSQAGGSAVDVAKLAGEAAGHAAEDYGGSPEDAGEAAADATFAAGGSDVDVATVAGESAAHAAEDSGQSPKDVGRATAEAVFAAAGTRVDVVKLASEAARHAANDAGKSATEIGATAGQAVIAAAQALAKRRPGFLSTVERGSNHMPKVNEAEAVIVIRKPLAEAANASPADTTNNWNGLPNLNRFMLQAMAAVTVLISLAIAASTIAVRIAGFCGLSTPYKKCIGTIHLQTKTVNPTNNDESSCENGDFDKKV